MRQVIIVLIALLAISIFMPAIMAKQGNTQPVLASITNMSKYTAPKADPDTAIFGITTGMKSFLDGNFTPSTANYKDVMTNNNGAKWDIYNFLDPNYTPSTVDVFPTATSVAKMHQMT